MTNILKRAAAILVTASLTVTTGIKVIAADDAVADLPENDRWYQEAIGFLAHLGIFTGDENGDMKPEDNVTRAEIAAIILREMNITEMNSYTDVFYDVDDTHWAANIIQTAYDNGIINGYDDGSFEPDDDVTYEQAVKMVMCAINYEGYALPYGGYPDGYLKVANDEDVTKHVAGKVGEAITRRNIAKLVYNSLTAPYPTASGVKNGGIEYTKSDDVTILSEKRDIYYIEGTITAAPGKSIDLSIDIKENQLAMNGEIINSEIENAADYVADYVRLFYVDPDGKGSDRTAVYAVPLTNKIETITIDAKDIDEITTGYTGASVSQLQYYTDRNSSKTKKIKLVDQPIIVYNDQPFTAANFSLVEAVNQDGTAKTFDEFITPPEGSVKAVDWSKDGKYDILFIESYETSVVKMATALRLQLEYPTSFGTLIKLDTDEDTSLNVTITRDEDPAELRNLQPGDVVSIRMNANFNDETYTGNKYINIDAVSDYIDGTVELVNDADGYKVVIDGVEYDVVDNEDVYNDLKSMMNTSGKFYLNKFGTIADVDSKILGGLSSGEEYGWLLSVYAEDSGEDITAKMFTQSGTIERMPLASKVDYWAPDATSNSFVSSEYINSKIIDSPSGNKYFLQADATTDAGTEKVAIRLCKYKTNSSGKITRLYLAVDETKVSEKSAAVRVDTNDLKEKNQRGGLFAGKYVIESNVPQITAPLYYNDLSEIENYGYRIADHEDFTTTNGEDGLSYNCFFADVSDYAPGVTIRLVKSQSTATDIEEYKTADDNRVIVISSINEAIDSNDETVYKIKGYYDGKEEEYTLVHNVLVAQVTEDVCYDKARYDANTIWTKDDDVKLTEVLHPGDVCGIAGNRASVSIVLRMVDTKGLAEHLANGGTPGTVQSGQFRLDEMFSPNRDRVIFGYITDIAFSPIVQFTLSVDDVKDERTSTGETSTTIGVSDISRVVQLVRISKSGKVTVEKTAQDAYEVQTGDYLFMRNFKNDASRELIAIRYNK